MSSPGDSRQGQAGLRCAQAHVRPVSSKMLRPRILIQSGSYELDNLGDQSMVRAAIGRISERLPGAVISVVSRSIQGLRSVAPGAHAVPVENKSEWKLVRLVYLGARKTVPSVDPFLRAHFPRLFHGLLRLKARKLINREVLRETDFMIVSGGAYFTDVFPGQAWSSLERMRAAEILGIPFALVGQGIGPLTDPAMRHAAAELLPRARLIAVRERETSLRLLHELGVGDENIFVTGDDAVEEAWLRRSADPGSSIGVNLRVAPYAGTSVDDATSMRVSLRSIVAATSAELVSLPVCISESVESSSDATVAKHILSGLGTSPGTDAVPTSVSDLIVRVSACRVVVTGSYHCAVFALSQGIPAVCVYNSEYYRIKFLGLKDLFGVGCEVISITSEKFSDRLAAATIEMWGHAASLRPVLLSAAEKQIAAGRRVYDELCSIIATEWSESRRSSGKSAA